MSRDPIVSFDDEPLLLVDESDEVIGFESKAACHDGQGRLHRAFSVFLFNERGELLLQQRSAGKRLWPQTWANSCCSHPRKNEDTHEAAHRRIQEELGVHVGDSLQFLYKFTYHASYEDKGSENELCWVFIGRVDDPIEANENEVSAWRFVPSDELQGLIEADPDAYTPWLKLEWRELRERYWVQVERLWAR